MEHPTFTKAKNGTLILKASDEAKAVGPQRQGYRAKQPEEVEARAHVASEGGDVDNATVVLSRWKVQFGTYQGKTFHWLLQNDVGYAVMDTFTRYSLAYPEFAEAVRFRQAFEEARVKSLQPGQEGLALVGFGDFKFESLQSLYDSKDPNTIRFVNYLRRTTPAPGSQMENAVRYVKKRDRQREGATAAAGAATTSTPVAASSSSCSRVSVSPSYQGPKAASQSAH
uniref:Si:dkey-43f9.4 n=1 Tax=Nothobranchius kadleci TaxID=1051664 RepID=A0A1A8CSW5_NOTKA